MSTEKGCAFCCTIGSKPFVVLVIFTDKIPIIYFTPYFRKIFGGQRKHNIHIEKLVLFVVSITLKA